ncbi:MAG: TatD family hydrolase [Bacteroidales bacterium]
MFIDIHTHYKAEAPDTLALLQIPTGQAIPDTGIFSCGIHPWDTSRLTETELTSLFSLLSRSASDSKNPLFAVGECGLDKLRGAALSVQQVWFKRQILLSEQSRRPLIVHCVKAWSELIALHNELKPAMPWIIHGFRGKPELAHQLLSKTNIFLSFGIKFNTETLLSTPLSKLFLETDDIQYDIRRLYYSVANERNISIDELISQIECNFASLNR